MPPLPPFPVVPASCGTLYVAWRGGALARGSRRMMSRMADPSDEPVPVAVITGSGGPGVGEAACAAVVCEMTVVDEQLSISVRMKGVPGTAAHHAKAPI